MLVFPAFIRAISFGILKFPAYEWDIKSMILSGINDPGHVIGSYFSFANMNDRSDIESHDGIGYLAVSFPKGSVGLSQDGLFALCPPNTNGLTEANTFGDEAWMTFNVKFVGHDFEFHPHQGNQAQEMGGGKLLGLYGMSENLALAKNINGWQVGENDGNTCTSNLGCFGSSGNRDNCFSIRVAWRNNGTGQIYLYLPDAEKQRIHICGDDVNCHTNSLGVIEAGHGSWTFERDKDTKVKLHIRLNSIGHSNGLIRVRIDDRMVWERSKVTFRTRPDITISHLILQCSFGGSLARLFASPKDQRILIRSVQVDTI